MLNCYLNLLLGNRATEDIRAADCIRALNEDLWNTENKKQIYTRM